MMNPSLPDEARGFELPKNLSHLLWSIRLYTHPNFDWDDKRSWQNDPKSSKILDKEYKR